MVSSSVESVLPEIELYTGDELGSVLAGEIDPGVGVTNIK